MRFSFKCEKKYLSEHILNLIRVLLLYQLIFYLRLHLGIYFSNPNRIDIKDCVCDEFYVNFKKVSRKNTIVRFFFCLKFLFDFFSKLYIKFQIYDDVFRCLPSDNITDLKILKDYPNRRGLSNSDPIKVVDFFKKIFLNVFNLF